MTVDEGDGGSAVGVGDGVGADDTAADGGGADGGGAVGVGDCAETVADGAVLTLGAVALPALRRAACDVQATSVAGSTINAAALRNVMRASMPSPVVLS